MYERAIDPKDEPSEYAAYPFARLQMLSACLESIKQCLDAFYSIPDARLFDTPYTTLTFLGHVLVVLSKLSLLQTKDWDPAYAQSVLNFAESMDKLTQKVKDAKALAESAMKRDNKNSLLQTVPKLFLMLPGTLQKVKVSHEAMYTAQTSSSSQRMQYPAAELDGTLMEDELLRMSASSFSDFFIEDFWQHLTWS